MADYYVEIVEHATETVVKRMGPMPRKKAEKVDDGASINMNHERFYMRIFEPAPPPEGT